MHLDDGTLGLVSAEGLREWHKSRDIPSRVLADQRRQELYDGVKYYFGDRGGIRTEPEFEKVRINVAIDILVIDGVSCYAGHGIDWPFSTFALSTTEEDLTTIQHIAMLNAKYFPSTFKTHSTSSDYSAIYKLRGLETALVVRDIVMCSSLPDWRAPKAQEFDVETIEQGSRLRNPYWFCRNLSLKLSMPLHGTTMHQKGTKQQGDLSSYRSNAWLKSSALHASHMREKAARLKQGSDLSSWYGNHEHFSGTNIIRQRRRTLLIQDICGAEG
ncbi:uncharacterized protein PAC_02611 [Phialocephala subalpina]|uniref:Uncharacterized protein n=1 Tax=Phialocephala subalpina TaxID=576137 RepID=A0A1L7WIY5_9HELO|nr:uncharacterized protein PAC_02611 [Phialocephala subalpina]